MPRLLHKRRRGCGLGGRWGRGRLAPVPAGKAVTGQAPPRSACEAPTCQLLLLAGTALASRSPPHVLRQLCPVLPARLPVVASDSPGDQGGHADSRPEERALSCEARLSAGLCSVVLALSVASPLKPAPRGPVKL